MTSLTAAALTLAIAAPATTEGTIAARDGAKLHYKRYGTGPQAILVPLGFIVEKDFARLARPDRSLVFYDQRNRGRSDTAPPERSTLADEVADMETVRAHFGFPKVTTIGYSYLGLMTVMYAIAHPDRVEQLVQIGPVPRKFGTHYPGAEMAEGDNGVPKDDLAAFEKLAATDAAEKDPQGFCEKQWAVMRYYLVGDPAHVEQLGASQCSMPNEWPKNLTRHWVEVRMPEMQKLDVPVETIRALKQRVLTIHGTRDRNAPYGGGREWAGTLLANARLVTIEGGAHQCFAEYPDRVFPAIEAFLAGTWPKDAEQVAPIK
jgi:pimeloyl-ACP methyl ester carboxylesterase